jgi:hypothetical protein
MNISKHFTIVIQVKFYSKSKLTKSRTTYLLTVHISESHCYIVKSNNLSTIFAVLYKSIITIKIILSCCHGNTDVNASLRSSVLINCKYFMLNQCLENMVEVLLHACISSCSCAWEVKCHSHKLIRLRAIKVQRY